MVVARLAVTAWVVWKDDAGGKEGKGEVAMKRGCAGKERMKKRGRKLPVKDKEQQRSAKVTQGDREIRLEKSHL